MDFFFLVFYRILDDIEMYEQQTPFELVDYIALSSFLNNFLYKAIQENIFGIESIINLSIVKMLTAT